jgi:hypothetical protein
MVAMGLLRKAAALLVATAGCTLALAAGEDEDEYEDGEVGRDRCGDRISDGANIMLRFSAVMRFWPDFPATLENTSS